MEHQGSYLIGFIIFCGFFYIFGGYTYHKAKAFLWNLIDRGLKKLAGLF